MAPLGFKFSVFDGGRSSAGSSFKFEKYNPVRSDGLHFYGREQYQHPAWAVKGIAPEVGVLVLAGQWAAGKTFIGIHLSVCRALRVEFMGRRTKPGAVLWIAAEGAGEVQPRVRAALTALGRDADECIPFVWIDDAPVLTKENCTDWLGDRLRAANEECREQFGVPVVQVVIDTAAAAFGIEDEQDNAEAAGIMKMLSDFAAEHRVLMIPVMHLGKNAEAGIRGASAYGAGADAILSVHANANQVTGQVTGRTLNLAKSRRGSTGNLGPFALVDVHLGVDDDGDPVTSCAVQFGGVEAEPEGKGRPRGRGVTTLLRALDEALIHAGRDHRPYGDGPVVKAAQIDVVRNAFERFYATGEEINNRTSKFRTAWKRAFDDCQAQNLIAAESVLQHGEFVWRLNPS